MAGITVNDMLAALNRFRGDIDVYEDGSVQLRPYSPSYNTVGGKDWNSALVRLVKDQRRLELQHVCGLRGFGEGIGDRCEACERK